MMKGQYEFRKHGDEDKEWTVVENLLTNLGIEALLEKLFLDDGTTILVANLFIGMLDEVVTKATLMAGITTEPTAAGGYARQTISRTTATWTIGQIGATGYRYALSNAVTFAAVGANYSRAITRLFLASAITGGTLISVGSPLSSPLQILNGESFQMRYRLFLD